VKLHWSPRSPFVRKAMIALHETGLLGRVECVRTTVSMSALPSADLLPDNPLSKIPTLVLDDGRALFDSRVIVEYLDGLHAGPKLFPADPERRIGHLRWMAFADGLTDILLLWRHERIRAEGTQSPTILAAFETKVRSSFAAFDKEAAELAAEPFGIGHISLVCTLGQMDFRYRGSNWRKAHPRLAAWHAEVARRPSVVATEVKDDGTGPQDPPWARGPALVFA
jgi:glutathione S-transferase